MATPPAAADVLNYLGTPSGESEFTETEIDDALASETAAQARVCRIPTGDGPYPPDLATALYRRVHRALNMKSKPLGYEAGPEGGLSYISANDSEIRRLEGPFRKRTVR